MAVTGLAATPGARDAMVELVVTGYIDAHASAPKAGMVHLVV